MIKNFAKHLAKKWRFLLKIPLVYAKNYLWFSRKMSIYSSKMLTVHSIGPR
jgi:hypothetical protein